MVSLADFVNNDTQPTPPPLGDSSTTSSSPSLSDFSQPTDVTDAVSTGQDLNAPNYSGLCQGFVDDVLKTPPDVRASHTSASAAWDNYQQTGQAVQGTQGIQPGDILYFQDPNNAAGHVGFYSGGDKFVSATEQDPKQVVKNQSVSAWNDLTGDTVLGYVKNPSNLPQIGGQVVQ